ncbi:MAG: hypothetical protein AAFS03_12100 [Pseudomonadota bacterium]
MAAASASLSSFKQINAGNAAAFPRIDAGNAAAFPPPRLANFLGEKRKSPDAAPAMWYRQMTGMIGIERAIATTLPRNADAGSPDQVLRTLVFRSHRRYLRTHFA